MMKEKERNENKILETYLAGYEDEKLSQAFQDKIIRNAIASANGPKIVTITPAWKRLSLAASVAAFAIGIIMSNQVFTNSNSTYDSLSFESQGLYSYLVEGE